MKDSYSTSIQLIHNMYPPQKLTCSVLFDNHTDSNIDILVIGYDMTWELTNKIMLSMVRTI